MGCSGSSEKERKYGDRSAANGSQQSANRRWMPSTRGEDPSARCSENSYHFVEQGRAPKRQNQRPGTYKRPFGPPQFDGANDDDDKEEQEPVQDQSQQFFDEEQVAQQYASGTPDFTSLKEAHPGVFPEEIAILESYWMHDQNRFNPKQRQLIIDEIKQREAHAQPKMSKGRRPRKSAGSKTAIHGEAGPDEMAERQKLEENQSIDVGRVESASGGLTHNVRRTR